MRYPEVLDYYFGLIDFSFPSERDSRIADPRFGVPKEAGTRKIRERLKRAARPNRPRRSTNE